MGEIRDEQQSSGQEKDHSHRSIHLQSPLGASLIIRQTRPRLSNGHVPDHKTARSRPRKKIFTLFIQLYTGAKHLRCSHVLLDTTGELIRNRATNSSQSHLHRAANTICEPARSPAERTEGRRPVCRRCSGGLTARRRSEVSRHAPSLELASPQAVCVSPAGCLATALDGGSVTLTSANGGHQH